MKLLAIVGTARRDGSVSRLCKSIIKGAEASGIECNLINLYDYTINYCTGCRTCSKDGRGKCCQEDDFEKVAAKFAESDITILGSPLYWANISGIMKNFFDRSMSLEYIFPKGDEYQKLPFFTKVKTAINEMKKIRMRDGIENKKYIIVTAMTGLAIIDIFTGQSSLFKKNMKQYIHGLKGKLIKTFVYTDTFLKFSKCKEEKMLRRAYNYGRQLRLD